GPRGSFWGVGHGCNMSFRRDALLAAGSFDSVLGAGTPTHGGEESAVFFSLLLTGGVIAYAPAALVRHDHPIGFGALHKRLVELSISQIAFYCWIADRHPQYRRAVASRFLPRLIRYARREVSPGSPVPWRTRVS